MLITFIRFPESGKTKTRLIPAVGAQQAAAIQHRMTVHTLARVAEFARESHITVELRITGAPPEQAAAIYGSSFGIRDQGEGPLGQRLRSAVRDAFQGDATKVVVIGTDCPALSPTHLRAAFAALAETDVVLGPALDGGYYLIGLRQDRPELFKGIAWSTNQVLEQTRNAANRLGLSVMLLETLPDIDRPEDLRHLPEWTGYASEPWQLEPAPAVQP
jgi:rSAM/selenodomain-associated transferase 1